MKLDSDLKKLTAAQREHLGDIIKRVTNDLTAKYVRGALKHRGTLMKMNRKQLRAERRAELLDLICYEYTDND